MTTTATCLVRWLGRLLSGGVLIVSSACSGPLDSVQYRAYLADPTHGLTQTQESNGVHVTCTYRPVDLLIAQDLTGMPASGRSASDSLRQAYAGKTYCSLALAKDSAAIENQFAANPTAFTQTLSYLNTCIAADVFLVTTPHDSVPALASMYPRQYGNTQSSTVLLIFDTRRLNLAQGFHISFHSSALQLSSLRFSFPATTLASIPELKFH